MPPTWEERVTLFCAYLIRIEKKQPSTVKSYVSAIKSKLIADNDDWNDKLVLLSSLINNCRLHNEEVRTRLPIRRPLLITLLYETNRLFNSVYNIVMYQAFFSFLYYGLLRIGEATASVHVIKAKDVHVDTRKQKLLFILYSSKTHCKGNTLQRISISAQARSEKYPCFCPFNLLSNYMQIRGGYDHDDEPLFVHSDGSVLTAYQARRVLKKLLHSLTLNYKLYNMHSFRKGRAADLLKQGKTVDQIKQFGRWRSNSIYKYLKD